MASGGVRLDLSGGSPKVNSIFRAVARAITISAPVGRVHPFETYVRFVDEYGALGGLSVSIAAGEGRTGARIVARSMIPPPCCMAHYAFTYCFRSAILTPMAEPGSGGINARSGQLMSTI
jgi:hypothetical protein